MKFFLLNYAIRQNAIAAIQNLDTETVYEVTIQPVKRKRSLAQNRCLHGWCNEISEKYAEHYGEHVSAKAWKQYLKDKFLGFDVNDIVCGSRVIGTKHTRDLKVGEFAEFLTKIEVWCATELGFDLSRGEWYDEAMRR